MLSLELENARKTMTFADTQVKKLMSFSLPNELSAPPCRYIPMSKMTSAHTVEIELALYFYSKGMVS